MRGVPRRGAWSDHCSLPALAAVALRQAALMPCCPGMIHQPWLLVQLAQALYDRRWQRSRQPAHACGSAARAGHQSVGRRAPCCLQAW
jgi:hypothetical protein